MKFDTVIGLQGISFCGSSIFGMVANTHPDVFHGGEVINITNPSFTYLQKQWWFKGDHGPKICRTCGNTNVYCDVYGDMPLPVSGNPYHAILKKIDRDVKVICDTSKSFAWFQRAKDLSPGTRFVYVVFLKDPVSGFLSFVRRKHYPWKSGKDQNLFTDFLELYISSYREILDNAKKSEYYVVFYDDFVASSKRIFDQLAVILGIDATGEFQPDNLQVFPHHNVLGNQETFYRNDKVKRTILAYADLKPDLSLENTALKNDFGQLWLDLLTDPNRLR